MVVPSPPTTRIVNKKAKALGIPTIDLSLNRSNVRELIIKACEEFGFFKVINHGVDKDIVARMEHEVFDFFAKPDTEKQRAGPAVPFGYGCKYIGGKGDMGELEYLLLHTNPLAISDRSKFISNDPVKFSEAANDYIEAVRELASELLELIAEGLWVPDKEVLSRLIRDVQSDSVLRFNHYPTAVDNVGMNGGDRKVREWDTSPLSTNNIVKRIGFGEHTDPQLLTILRSNDSAGLQMQLHDGLWVPVPPDPTAFYVLVGDSLQVFTNERFKAIRHMALANTYKPRMSMMYFAAPPLNAWLHPLKEMVSPQNPSHYRAFTWNEFKKVIYSLRLHDTRLDYFRTGEI